MISKWDKDRCWIIGFDYIVVFCFIILKLVEFVVFYNNVFVVFV